MVRTGKPWQRICLLRPALWSNYGAYIGVFGNGQACDLFGIRTQAGRMPAEIASDHDLRWCYCRFCAHAMTADGRALVRRAYATNLED